MTQEGIAINGSILRWARETANLSLEDAASRAKIGAPRKLKRQEQRSAADRLRAWEEGQEKPTIAQLKLMAKGYRRPLVTFFLPAPPKQANVFADFRTVTKRPAESIEFAALKRRIVVLHRELAGIAEDENANILPFVNSASEALGSTNIVASINETLGFDAGWQTKKAKSINETLGFDAGWQTKKAKFKYLRTKAQDAGYC